jgi:hypothetical protein
MAEVLNKFPVGLRERKHTYDRYIDGQVWKIEATDHPTAQPASVRTALHGAAKKAGMRIHTHHPNGIGHYPIIVQAVAK